jgi:multiple sugar transport system permease protein
VELHFHAPVRIDVNLLASGITVLVILMGAACGYAISQLKFPGRTLLWWMILASFMVPIQALIVNHFIIMAGVKLLNSYPGIILPQLIAPVVVIVYKQFFDSVPREFGAREPSTRSRP